MRPHRLIRAARARRGAIMIVALLMMTILLVMALGLLRLTGSGVEDAARATNTNQAQGAANVAVQQAIAWLNAVNLTGVGDGSFASLDQAITARAEASDPEGRSAALGRSCYEWALVPGSYDAEAGTLEVTGRGISPGELDGGACVAPVGDPHENLRVVATVKLAPGALGYAIAGNDIYLGEAPATP